MPRFDDLTLTGAVVLLRRVHPTWIHYDTALGRYRPGTGAFRDNLSNELSLYVATETTPERILEGRPHDSLVSVSAGAFREHGYTIVRDTEEEETGHVVVIPAPKKGHAGRIAKQAEWVVFREPPTAGDS